MFTPFLMRHHVLLSFYENGKKEYKNSRVVTFSGKIAFFYKNLMVTHGNALKMV